MNEDMVRPHEIPCGSCKASTVMEWGPVGQGHWAGLGQCPSCGSHVLSVSSESGVDLGLAHGLFDVLLVAGTAGSGALIA